MHKLLFCQALPPSCKVIKSTSIWASYTAFQRFCPEKNKSLCHQKHRTPLELHKASAPELSGTLPSTCTGTLQNLTGYLHRTHRNLNTVSAPEPSGTSPASCTETLRNLNRYLHRNPPEPEPSKNFTRYLHRNPPQPQQVSAPSGTLRNLARNLVLKLRRIAPELIWAKDPIANFCCWEKNTEL